MLIIHSETESEPGALVQSLLEKMNVSFELFAVRPCPDGQAVPAEQFRTMRDSFTHGLILPGLPARYLGFFAGFCLGANLPFVVYGGEAAAAMEEEFASCFISIKTEVELQQYFAAEIEVSKKQELDRESRAARETLLHMGIPVSENSLIQCVSKNTVEAVALFFTAGFSANVRDNGVPLLNIAARKGNKDTVKLLLQSGARVDLLAEDRSSTALLDAVMGKYDDIVMDLVEAGTDVNVRSKDGQSALIVAVGANDDLAVETLLKAGADPDVSDSLGVSARKYAALFHKTSITSLFETYAPAKTV